MKPIRYKKSDGTEVVDLAAVFDNEREKATDLSATGAPGSRPTPYTMPAGAILYDENSRLVLGPEATAEALITLSAASVPRVHHFGIAAPLCLPFRKSPAT
jgi:hypothetical protein